MAVTSECQGSPWACSMQVSEGTTAALALEKGENMTNCWNDNPHRELEQASQGYAPLLCPSRQMEED